MTAIAPVLQSFFTDRLMTQLHASPHTIASYCVPRTWRSGVSAQGRLVMRRQGLGWQ